MALVDFTNPDATTLVPGAPARPARPGRRRDQDRLRRADPDRRGLARRQRPRGDAPPLHAALQPGGVRRARGGARRGRGGAVRPFGDGRRPVDARALGRRQLLVVHVDGREPARRPLARVQRLRLLEPRHRRLRGRPRPGGVQALARVRAAVEPLAAARLDELPGAVGVRRRRRGAGPERGRGGAHVREAQGLAAALPRRGGRGGAPHRAARSCGRCSSSSPATPRSPTSTGSTCSGPSLLVAPVFSATGEVEYYLPGRALDELVHARGRRGRRLAARGARVRHGAAVGARGRGHPGRRRGRRAGEVRG